MLGYGRGAPRYGVRDPRRRQRPDLPAPRERDRTVAGRRQRLRADVDAQRDAPAEGREDVEVARQHRLAPRRGRGVGRGDAAPLLPRRSLAEADRLLRRGPRAGSGAGRRLPERLRQRLRRRLATGLGAVRRGTRRRLQYSRGARGHARVALGRESRVAAPGAAAVRPPVAGRAGDGAGRPPDAGPRASRRAHPRRLRRGGPAARRDRGRRLGGPRRGGRLPARPEVTREQVYGRRPVREALRGPREVLELWATERAVKAEPWLREPAGPRVQVKAERELSEAAGTRDHQGVVAWCEPYRYADAWEVAAEERPLIVCLDQVSDPRNLGAVCRSAEGAGATAVVLPAHGSARLRAAIWGASAGAAEHVSVAVVPTLARYLGVVKRGDLWIDGAV